MKQIRIAVVAVALACLAGSAHAQTPSPEKERTTLSIMFGFMRVQKAGFDVNTGELTGVSGPLIGVNVHIPMLRRMTFNPTVIGFTTGQSITDGGDLVTVDTRNFAIELPFRFYAGPENRARGFVEAGPTLNFVKAAVLVDVTGLPFISESDTGTKMGGIFGGGVQVPLSPRVGVEAVAEYALVPKFNELNYSTFRLMGGFAIRFGK